MTQALRVPLLKFLLILTGIGAIAYLLICFSLLVWQTRLIFVPSPEITTTPAELGLPHEEVWLPIREQNNAANHSSEHSDPPAGRLHGWWLPAQATDPPILLYLHGNGGNISVNLQRASNLAQLGFSVLLIDYRGYGLSEGKFPNENQVYEDAVAAWDYLVQQRGFEPRDIFVYGHSLGGAIAIELATQRPEVPGLILEGTFTSMNEMATLKGRYRIFPISLLLTQRFDSRKKISALQMPILFIHGTDDLVVPAWMSEALHAASQAPKQLFLVPGAGHNNVGMIAGSQYLRTIWQFVMQVRTSGTLTRYAATDF